MLHKIDTSKFFYTLSIILKYLVLPFDCMLPKMLVNAITSKLRVNTMDLEVDAYICFPLIHVFFIIDMNAKLEAKDSDFSSVQSSLENLRAENQGEWSRFCEL